MYDSPIAAWRQFKTHYRLEGVQCASCKKIHLHTITVCTCGNTTFTPYQFNHHGTLVSFTNVTTPPHDFKAMTPYCIGLIQLDDGPRLVAQLTDVTLDQLQIGMPMHGVLRKLYALQKGIIHYGIKFAPEFTNAGGGKERA